MFSRPRSFLTAWTRRGRFEDSLDEEVRSTSTPTSMTWFAPGCPGGRRCGAPGIHSRQRRRYEGRLPAGPRPARRRFEIARDVKHAGRFLRHNPGFGLVAIATLGLSIGATVWCSASSMQGSSGLCALRSPTVSPSASTLPGNGRPNRRCSCLPRLPELVGTQPTALGRSLGLGLWMSRMAESMPFGVEPREPVVFAGAAFMITVVGPARPLGAGVSGIQARPGARADPDLTPENARCPDS